MRLDGAWQPTDEARGAHLFVTSVAAVPAHLPAISPSQRSSSSDDAGWVISLTEARVIYVNANIQGSRSSPVFLGAPNPETNGDSGLPQRAPIDSVQPHPKNARQGDVGAIVQSMKINGVFRPLYVHRSSGHILAGTHTWKAMKAERIPEVPVIWLDVDDDEAGAITDEAAFPRDVADLRLQAEGLSDAPRQPERHATTLNTLVDRWARWAPSSARACSRACSTASPSATEGSTPPVQSPIGSPTLRRGSGLAQLRGWWESNPRRPP